MPIVIPEIRTAMDVEVPAGTSARIGAIRITPGKPTNLSPAEIALLDARGIRVRVLPVLDRKGRPGAAGAVTAPVTPDRPAEDPDPTPEPQTPRRRKRRS